MILTGSGHVGIERDGKEYVLKPTLLAMSKLGSPTEIVQLFYRVATPPDGEFVFVRDGSLSVTKRQDAFMGDCVSVLWACADEVTDDLAAITGHLDESGAFVMGSMPMEDVYHIASHLLKHGIAGDQIDDTPVRSRGRGGYIRSFNPMKYIAIAVAHLGLSEEAAANLTMTGLAAYLQEKYPPIKDKNAKMTVDELPPDDVLDEELARRQKFADQVAAIMKYENEVRNG